MAALRPTWVEVDLGAIAHNARSLKAQTNAQLMAVVKADGYGHGAVEVAETALANGASWLAVAIPEEGVALRRAGITAPILILGYFPADQADLLVEHGLTGTVGRPEQLAALDKAARAAGDGGWFAREGRPVPVHLKVDTGMGRLGVRSGEEAVAFARWVGAFPSLELEGVFTHLSCADEPDPEPTAAQLRAFEEILQALEAEGIRPRIRHAGNSAGIIGHPASHFDLVRAGISLYGYWPSDHLRQLHGANLTLRPALTWRARLSHVKTVSAGSAISYGATYRAAGHEVVGTVPVGYADGYNRAWSNRGQVLVDGAAVPIRGRVCMDQIMIAAPPGMQTGDLVTLLGPGWDADDWARELGTISYEVLCLISRRVPRLYI